MHRHMSWHFYFRNHLNTSFFGTLINFLSFIYLEYINYVEGNVYPILLDLNARMNDIYNALNQSIRDLC